jgi:predicted RNA polymerase sigma factor
MILSEAMTNISLKDIARRYFVSDKTVQRVVNAEAKAHKHLAKFCPYARPEP